MVAIRHWKFEIDGGPGLAPQGPRTSRASDGREAEPPKFETSNFELPAPVWDNGELETY